MRLRSPRRTHRLEDKVVHADLGADLNQHIGPDWYAWIYLADGSGMALGQSPATRRPPAAIWNRLNEVAQVLNEFMHEGGHWVVALSSANEPVLLWRDFGGDAHVCVEIDAKGEKILLWEPSDFMQQANEGLVMWRVQEGKVEVRPGQQYFRALGEKAPSRH